MADLERVVWRNLHPQLHAASRIEGARGARLRAEAEKPRSKKRRKPKPRRQ